MRFLSFRPSSAHRLRFGIQKFHLLSIGCAVLGLLEWRNSSISDACIFPSLPTPVLVFTPQSSNSNTHTQTHKHTHTHSDPIASRVLVGCALGVYCTVLRCRSRGRIDVQTSCCDAKALALGGRASFRARNGSAVDFIDITYSNHNRIASQLTHTFRHPPSIERIVEWARKRTGRSGGVA